jgi:hypothetical protein
MRTKRIIISQVFILLFFLASKAQRDDARVKLIQRPASNASNKYYVSNRSPLIPLSFVKLPVGSIQPGGWLLKYLELQRDGLTGHLGEISAWLDKNNNAWFSGNGQGDHGWEEVPYWLKGYGDLGYILHNTKMINETKSWIEKVFQSQKPDGYFGPSITDSNFQVNHGKSPDLWPNMIMLWCLQSYYDFSHDSRVISFMTKYFKWEMAVPDDKLLELYWENSRGGDNLYSIYWLFNRTGEKWLLELAEKIHRNTANWAQQNNLPNWHNVNVAQCFREPATYYMQAKDSSLLQATYNDFFLIRNLYGQVPGGMFGADENARKGYTDPRQAVETCGMVEQMASDEILMSISGDPMWADNCEDVAFNTYPAAVMPDFKGLRYLTAPNMVVSDSKNHAPGIQNEGPYLMMNPFSSRCCQHNHAQGWPYYAEHLWMATPDDGVAAILYSSSKVTLKVGTKKNQTVTLVQTTHYPFDDHIKIQINAGSPVRFPLYLRIPGWCDQASVKINGKSVSSKAKGDSYFLLTNEWRSGDIIELMLPMKISIREWTNNKNSVSLNYGPLSFSIKIDEYYKMANSTQSALGEAKWQSTADQTQWPSYEIYPKTAWNYGLVLNKKTAAEQFELIKKPWPANDFPFTVASVPWIIRARGKIIPDWGMDQYGLCSILPQSPVTVSTNEETIELIPMGAARLRLAAIPVVK